MGIWDPEPEPKQPKIRGRGLRHVVVWEWGSAWRSGRPNLIIDDAYTRDRRDNHLPSRQPKGPVRERRIGVEYRLFLERPAPERRQ